MGAWRRRVRCAADGITRGSPCRGNASTSWCGWSRDTPPDVDCCGRPARPGRHHALTRAWRQRRGAPLGNAAGRRVSRYQPVSASHRDDHAQETVAPGPAGRLLRGQWVSLRWRVELLPLPGGSLHPRRGLLWRTPLLRQSGLPVPVAIMSSARGYTFPHEH